jgi:hypothetical protein
MAEIEWWDDAQPKPIENPWLARDYPFPSSFDLSTEPEFESSTTLTNLGKISIEVDGE